jgi:glycosyltransferase involved in cell wall biosynthesis
MSVGRPVIGTRIGGIPEIIDDGINGYLVEPKNPEQIAEKVIKLFAESTLLITMGRNARKKAEQFSIEKYAKKIGKIYEEIIRKNKNSKDTNSALQSVSWLSLQEETGESEDYS